MAKWYGEYDSQEELDKDFDVEKSVPDFMVYARAWFARAEETRAKLECRLQVPYGPTLMETVDVFPATSPPPGGAPIVVFIHGGYWRILTANELSHMALGPVAAGYAVVNVTYGLCPGVTIPEITRQIRAAVAWTYRNAESFGGDPAKIYVTGHSAGGHLAMMAGLTDWAGVYGLPGDIIKGLLPVSGVFDLRPLQYSFMQPSLRLTGTDVQEYSPTLLARPCPIPTIVAWGGAETNAFHQQSGAFFTAWTQAGNTPTKLVVPDTNHFTVVEGFETPTGALTQALLSLADR
jgi:arylformamidase